MSASLVNVAHHQSFLSIYFMSVSAVKYRITGGNKKVDRRVGVPYVGGTFPSLCSGGTSIFWGT